MGEAVWIDEPNEEIYFSPEDESYIPNYFPETPIGAMVHYGNEDHTAVTTKTPNRYISKDGANPIVYHTGTSFAGYDGEDTQIYIRVSYQNVYDFWGDTPSEMVITGLSSIAYGSSATYSVSNLPSGATVSWSASPSHLVNISIVGNTATVSPIFNSNSSFTLTASVSGESNPLTKSIDITSSVPDLSIQGPNQVCSSGATFTLTPDPGVTPVNWQVSSNLSISGSSTGASLLVYPSGTGNGTVSVYSNGNFIDSKSVWVGGPLQVSGVFPLNINGPNEFCSNQIYTLTVMDNNPSSANVTGYTWGVEGTILSGQGSSTIEAQFTSGSILSVRANNQCGGGTWLHIPYTILPVYYCQGGGELFSMSPNPANEVVNITFNNPEEGASTASTEELSYTIRIYDQYSHFIKKIKCNTEEVSIDISFLDPGIYYLQIEYNGAKFAQTLLVE
ncbi:MAG: T9SS type A sorting domain-containing protein [Bacteroidales bacterium]|nr:T9SS type A sorting domain-containing protein [Bacteroidales bacterium]